jgi:hypothetical protein
MSDSQSRADLLLPACRGEVTSKRKAATSRANGKLGGRLKGSKNNPKSKPQKERR